MTVEALWDELETTLVPLLLGYRARLDAIEVARKDDRTLLTEADLAVHWPGRAWTRTGSPACT